MKFQQKSQRAALVRNEMQRKERLSMENKIGDKIG